MKNTWDTPEWKEAKEKFLAEHPFCEWHGEPVKSQVVHHLRKCKTLEEYLSMKYCKALCNKCHFAVRKKLKLCPECKRHYFRNKRNRDMCWECFTKTPFGKKIKAQYEKRKT